MERARGDQAAMVFVAVLVMLAAIFPALATGGSLVAVPPGLVLDAPALEALFEAHPIDCMKIDASFVRGIPMDASDVAITDTILAMAGSLGLKVVAEGVETEDQLAFLRENGCDEMQGYLFAKPTGAEECAAMLREGRRLEIPGGRSRPGAQLKRIG